MLFAKIVHRFAWGAACAAAMLLVVLTIRAQDAKENEKRGNGPAASKPAAKHEAAKPEAKDRYAVPAAGVEELVKFIEELESFRPANAREYFAHRQKAPVALEAAANKILELEKDKESAAAKKASGVLLQLSARRIGQVEAEEQRAILDKLTDYLSHKELTPADLRIAMNVGRALEYSDAREMAAEAYDRFGKIYSKSKDEQVASFGEMLAGSARRLKLVGNALELQGTKLDGTKFDVGELKGKVVLVDFWATWCGPCRAEFPNVKKAYDQYHEHGFEVVGVSLDQNREALEKYIQEKEVPWITLHEKDAGGKNPATTRYGILGIPTMFLIGRDGNVISIHARGNELTRLLDEQFGDLQATDDTRS